MKANLTSSVDAAFIKPLSLHRRTVSLGNGKADLGHLTEEMVRSAGSKAGPIRLLQGFHAPNAKGFGLAHIEANQPRVKQLSGLGFRDATTFVAHIAANFTLIAKARDERLALVVAYKNGWLHLIVEWDHDCFWSCTTAIPKRHKRGLDVVWSKPRPDESEPTSDEVSTRRRFETLSLPKQLTGKES